MRIGIDVGGTNTDAVLMDGVEVIAACKQPTEPDATLGVVRAMEALQQSHPFDWGTLDAVMIGTTHFINALIEQRGLAPTAAIRIGLPATSALPPLVEWPANLVRSIAGRPYLVHGGHEYDGSRLAPIDPDELRRAADDAVAHGVRAIALSSVFAPVSADAELEAARILSAHLGPEVSISLSHEIGRIGLLERENATVINAALRELADHVLATLTQTLRTLGVTAPLYLSQNDGTLMDIEHARAYPVSTFASGPTNSMRGAALLSGLDACAVVDVGGTTSDIGVLENGFPRQSRGEVLIAGVRTNFRMPDVLSLGIGGGSLIDVRTAAVGPGSVGYRLPQQSRVFGGDVLTATDIAVAAGRADVGDASRVADLDRGLVAQVLGHIDAAVARAIDGMRLSPEPLAVVAVGGGSLLLPDVLDGLGEVRRPNHYAVANAVGAAIAQVGGEVDRMYTTADGDHQQIVDAARQEAFTRAVIAGARADSVSIVDFEELPIPYLPGQAVRVRVKAVGDLDLTKASAHV